MLCTPICQIYLQRALNDLHNTQESRNDKDKYRYPECIPLDAIPRVKPPLKNGPGAGFIKRLLQDDKLVMPIAKILDFPFVSAKPAVL